MNFIQDSFQSFPQHFKSTFYWLLQAYYITQKMYIFEYVCKTFFEELALLNAGKPY